jgi:uncharacterized protein YjbI with pentapeptide repeats
MDHSPKSPQLPSIRQLNQYPVIGLEDDQIFEQGVFTVQSESQNAKRLSFIECAFDHTNLNETIFPKTHLRDCRLDHVDLSNADWPESNLATVLIVDSKLTGWKLNESILSDITLKDCKLDYAQLQLIKGKRIMFDHCDLTQAYCNESDMRNTVFKNCNLSGTDFSKTRLQGADLRGSFIEGVKIDVHFLQGVKVDLAQALYIAHMLGLEIE